MLKDLDRGQLRLPVIQTCHFDALPKTLTALKSGELNVKFAATYERSR
jgi:hypothetical protein